MKRTRIVFCALVAELAVAAPQGQVTTGPTTAASIADVQRQFASPPDESRIMMRWWWFGPSVTPDELEAEMRRMKEGGIGGFEVATVYPMAVDDPARGFRNFPYLSSEFLDKIAFASQKARELGLRMDLTVGSGWSYGGPYITSELSAARLRSDRREVAPTVLAIARPTPYEHDTLIAAFIGRGSLQEVDASSFVELDISGNGPIRLPKGDGPRVVLFYYSGPTGQVVKRAAVGAEGYVLDHYNRAAIETHLREAGDRMLAAAGRGGIASVFCDSLEVYDADWTADLLSEFRRRRGYDLRPLLPLLEFGSSERAETGRRDFGRTLTELFEDRFLVPMHQWASKNHVLFRIQDYGQPPGTLASYRHADVFDGEGFEWRTLSATRWASSASHLFGRPVTSSETWTWIHSPAFRATPLDLKAEADLHFLSGINQLIGHGWPYSPPAAGTPGWPFYAAGALSDKNPWWPVMPDLARYLQRASFVLRQGEPVADVAIYAPTEDAWSMIRPATGRALNLWMSIRDQIGPKIVTAILDGGHGFDLIDDGMLKEAEKRGYRLIVLPGVRHMPETTKRWLDAYERSGGTGLAVRRKPEGIWPSLDVASEDELPRRLSDLLQSDLALTPPTPSIGFVHRRLPDGDVYFVANTSNVARTFHARFGVHAAHAELWNALTGSVERLEVSSGSEAALTLEPYASRFVVFRKESSAAPAARPGSTFASEELRSGWSVTFGAAGASKTVVNLPHSWTDEAVSRYYSGTSTYRRTFQLSPTFRSQAARVFLDFGDATPIEREALAGGTLRGNSFAALVAPPIREAAIVFVNGKPAGALWCPPYRLDITDLVRDGGNELRIDVYNTAINQLAEGGRLPDLRAVVERYGQRFRLQDLDDVHPILSGIVSVPRIVEYR